MEGSILRDEDNIKELELKIESLQASVFFIIYLLITIILKGKYIECVEILEQILILKKKVYGENHDEVL